MRFGILSPSVITNQHIWFSHEAHVTCRALGMKNFLRYEIPPEIDLTLQCHATALWALWCFFGQQRFCYMKKKVLAQSATKLCRWSSVSLSTASAKATRHEVPPRKHSTCEAALRESSAWGVNQDRPFLIANSAYSRWLWTGCKNVTRSTMLRFKTYPMTRFSLKRVSHICGNCKQALGTLYVMLPNSTEISTFI